MKNKAHLLYKSLCMFKKIIFISVVVLTMVACQGANELTVATQEETIDSYITANYTDDQIVRNGGSNRIIVTPGIASVVVAKGDSVAFYYNGYIFTSKGAGTQFVSDSTVVAAGEGYMIDGLDKGLTGASLGEECYIIFSAKYGFYNKEVGLVPAMSPLMYHVLIANIKKKK